MDGGVPGPTKESLRFIDRRSGKKKMSGKLDFMKMWFGAMRDLGRLRGFSSVKVRPHRVPLDTLQRRAQCLTEE